VSARDFLVRGLLAGLIAGLAAFGVAFAAGEPALDAAIAIEGSNASHHDDPTEESPVDSEGTAVSRSVQATVGLLTGTLLAGVTLGGLAGLLSGFALGRFGGLGPRATALSVVTVMFVTLDLVPFVGYPPNPPGVGQADTIGQRTALYFVLMAISVIAAVMVILIGRRAAHRWGGWYAILLSIGSYLIIISAVIVLMPAYDEVPASFPASLLYEFRVASLGTRLTLWAVLGVMLAELVYRLTRRSQPVTSPIRATAG
jgi:predicted cobalt transporter CbtA